jgi:hypothetical protein
LSFNIGLENYFTDFGKEVGGVWNFGFGFGFGEKFAFFDCAEYGYHSVFEIQGTKKVQKTCLKNS